MDGVGSLHPRLLAGCWGGAGLPCSQCCPRESGVGVRMKATEGAELARAPPCRGRLPAGLVGTAKTWPRALPSRRGAALGPEVGDLLAWVTSLETAAP